MMSHSHRGLNGGGGPRDEEMELCAVHGNMRPLKHLAYRGGQYECIHGFHCLESSAPQSLSTTPKKDYPTLVSSTSPSTMHHLQGAYTGGASIAIGGPQRSPPESGGPGPAEPEQEVDVAKLHSLLQSVKQLQMSSE